MVVALEKSLSSFFDQKTFSRGKEYFRYGCVSKCFIKDNIITSQVSGSQRTPYNTQIALILLQGTVIEIIGNCSCPVGFNCKHVVATLLQALSQYKQSEQKNDVNKINIWKDWLNELHNAKELTDDECISNDAILYKLESQIYPNRNERLFVQLLYARKIKTGGFGKSYSLSYGNAKWIQAADLIDNILLYHLQKSSKTSMGPYYLDPKKSDELIQKLLESRRLFWGNDRNMALKLSEARYISFDWKLNHQGTQKLIANVKPEAILLPLSPPWYIDPKTCECGRILSKINDKYFPEILSSPVILPTEIQSAKKTIAENFKEIIPLPRSLSLKKQLIHPKPRLYLFEFKKPAHFNYFSNEKKYCLIKLTFIYENTEISYNNVGKTLYYKDEDKIIPVERQLAYEQKSLHYLLNLEGVYPVAKHCQSYDVIKNHQNDFLIGLDNWSELDKLNVLQKIIPRLRKKGWIIDIDPDFSMHWIEEESQTWYFDIHESSGIQWFDLEISIDVAGEKINLLPILIEVIQRNQDLFLSNVEHEDKQFILHQLPDKRYIQISLRRIQNILSALSELRGPIESQKKLTLSKLRSAEMLELAKDLEWRQGQPIKEFAKKLKNFREIKSVAVPEILQTKLRTYQQLGLDWLQFLREYQLGGILADDMGLGKTIQTLAHIAVEKQSGNQKQPCLVIAPTSLIVNWKLEAKKFVPSLKTLEIHGPHRNTQFSHISQSDLVITTYPILLRDYEKFCKETYHILILDEAQWIKNPKSKIGKACRQIQANQRLCLSGTPIENRLTELWSLFDFLNPGFLGSLTQFNRLFCTPIEKYQVASVKKTLSNRTAPFILRRTKEQVAQELPQKIEITHTVELQGSQRDLYESIRLTMHKKVKDALEMKGFESSHIIILEALLKLRQVCCDPRLLKINQLKDMHESAKIKLLLEMLDKLIAEKRKVLLFSSFAAMLELIEKYLLEKNISYEKLTGKTKNRQEKICNFQEGKVDIFLISLKAGGVGLNLTKADTVIHYDPWWNPAAENQATDRAHRIGQNKPVFVYKLITANTVEEKILILQEKKKALVDSLLQNTKSDYKRLCREDLECLFEPLENK